MALLNQSRLLPLPVKAGEGFVLLRKEELKFIGESHDIERRLYPTCWRVRLYTEKSSNGLVAP